jgi:hypothetical protein
MVWAHPEAPELVEVGGAGRQSFNCSSPDFLWRLRCPDDNGAITLPKFFSEKVARKAKVTMQMIWFAINAAAATEC